ncbi:MAG: acyl-CoA dehydrogenase family protein [Hyphomicrobiaceae bacterium]
MDFALTEEHRKLRDRCRELAADFATRSSAHDRDASHPTENYDRLRQEGFLELSIPKEYGGAGIDFLGHTLAYEALGQGCPSTALSFNMHSSVVMPLMDFPQVTPQSRRLVADLVVCGKQLVAGNYSEATSTALIGERWLDTIIRRVDGGWEITGRKMFASMLQAADYCLVLARPDTAKVPTAGAFVLIPRHAEGRSVIANWDVMGMRATRSDSLVLDKCRLPENAVAYQSDDIREFRRWTASWAWGSYTAVYLGVAGAAFNELLRVVKGRQVPGYSQTLAYHPDVRRQVAQLSADLEAARLITYRSAWLYVSEGPTEETTAALFRAKYVVGEALARIVRVALTLSGSHGIFKGGRIEQLYRDGALGTLHAPPSDFCLWNMGIHELGLDPAEVTPPLKPAPI